MTDPMSPSATPWGHRLSFSLLKAIATSPAHFLAACSAEREPTPAMRRGTLVHWFLLGGPESRRPLICPVDGTRATKAFKEWRDTVQLYDNPGDPDRETYTKAEADEARTIAHAAQHAPHNRDLFQEWIAGASDTELPLAWTMGGIPFRTRGVDVLHRARGLLVDVKTCASAEPDAFAWEVRKRKYGAQLATYALGCEANGIPIRERALFAIETSAPYVVTVLRHPDAAFEQDKRTLALWIERVRGCQLAGHWPGYVSTAVDLETGPIELQGLDDLEEAS